jgi:hypothetical protein
MKTKCEALKGLPNVQIIAQRDSSPLSGLSSKEITRALVAHACNPSYSGGRNQEDLSLKPAWANSSQDPISKTPITKKGWWSGSRCRPRV